LFFSLVRPQSCVSLFLKGAAPFRGIPVVPSPVRHSLLSAFLFFPSLRPPPPVPPSDDYIPCFGPLPSPDGLPFDPMLLRSRSIPITAECSVSRLALIHFFSSVLAPMLAFWFTHRASPTPALPGLVPAHGDIRRHCTWLSFETSWAVYGTSAPPFALTNPARPPQLTNSVCRSQATYTRRFHKQEVTGPSLPISYGLLSLFPVFCLIRYQDS